MKTPTWGVVIGILMVLFGGCSVMNDINAIRLPSVLEKQRAILHEKAEERKNEEKDEREIEEEAETNQDTTLTEATDSLEFAEAMEDEEDMKKIENILNVSEFTKTWMVRFGYIGIVISVLYLLAGIFLLIPKKFSIKLAYTALILSITLSGTSAVILTTDSTSTGFIGLVTGFSQIFGVIIDIVLLAIIFASEKEAYTALPVGPQS
jgi:VIT1/CCC1 family predicted Fe2+/Mn2+ transporter